ncbi:MAG: arylsulfatase [Xanthomonadales bacterium]|nr:arylsulfatase [Xanthomonadales bacterium]
MNRLRIMSVLLAALLAVPAWAAGRPNIVLIMVDDMGYSDPGFIGGDIETPNIDRLADEGVVFEQFYNNAKCSQTRASLMSGLYYQQSLKKGPSGNLGHNQLAVPNNTTIAEVLKEAGYATALAGKWHLGQTPYERGFEKFYGFLDGAGPHWYSPRVFGDFDVPRESFYSSDAYTDAGISFIEQGLESDRPFFLYLSFAAPHYPLHAFDTDIAKYDGHFAGGWDKVRERRVQHMKEAGFIAESFAVKQRLTDPQPWDTTRNGWDWDTLNAGERAEQESLMETYAAMLDRVDQNIGRLLERLESLGVKDNTAIFFLSDNGGSPYPNHDEPGTEPGPPGSWRTLNTPWAQVNSTPFSLFKRYSHEGGISTPMVAYWPTGLAEKGRRNRTPHHVIDFMPTLLELAGAEYPLERFGDPVLPMAGRSFLPVLKNAPDTDPRKLYWDYANNHAVRDGRWKLVQSNLSGQWELYDIEADRGETRDLAAEHPEIAGRLLNDWNTWHGSVSRHEKVNQE